jgi:L-threonylcarbamoyladenylate synthase
VSGSPETSDPRVTGKSPGARAPQAASGSQAEAFERCIADGGVAAFPSDTVYGLACDPGNRDAVERLYGLKGRSLDKPSAVMFFDRARALSALPELGPRTTAALERLLPGPVSLLLPNPAARFPLACGGDPGALGLRVVDVPALAGVGRPVLQSSANHAGGPDARTLADVPEEIRRRCELVIDGGPLPGTPSTVIDLRGYERSGRWSVVREGGLPLEAAARALGSEPPEDPGRFRFDPDGYAEMMRADIPAYDRLQAVLGEAAAVGARRVLELGTGTGETALRLLAANPEATLVGVDENEAMLAAAAERLPAGRVTLRVGRIEQPLPAGRFELVASALCVHHLDAAGKRDLFARVRERLAPGGRFVLADVVVPEDPGDAVIETTPGYDKPDSLADQLRWLAAAGFEPTVAWSERDLAVVVARAP